MEAIFLSNVFQHKLNNNNKNNDNFCHMKENRFHYQSQFVYTAALTQHMFSWMPYLLEK